jgi:hypothetical protein
MVNTSTTSSPSPEEERTLDLIFVLLTLPITVPLSETQKDKLFPKLQPEKGKNDEQTKPTRKRNGQW